MGIDERDYRLREVYDCSLAVPVQDVVRRQVAVDEAVGEHQVYVPQYPLKEGACLLPVQPDVDESRCRAFYVAYELHKYGVLILSEGLRHVSTRSMEAL